MNPAASTAALSSSAVTALPGLPATVSTLALGAEAWEAVVDGELTSVAAEGAWWLSMRLSAISRWW